jgi:hypothetical protein
VEFPPDGEDIRRVGTSIEAMPLIAWPPLPEVPEMAVAAE